MSFPKGEGGGDVEGNIDRAWIEGRWEYHLIYELCRTPVANRDEVRHVNGDGTLEMISEDAKSRYQARHTTVLLE